MVPLYCGLLMANTYRAVQKLVYIFPHSISRNNLMCVPRWRRLSFTLTRLAVTEIYYLNVALALFNTGELLLKLLIFVADWCR